MITTLTDASFEEFILKKRRVVVDFYSDWCPPCKVMEPIINELARQFKGLVAFGKVDVDQNKSTALRYGVLSIPTFIIFMDAEVVDRVIGAVPKALFEAKLKKHIK